VAGEIMHHWSEAKDCVTGGHAPSLLLANQRGVTLDCPKKRVTVGVARRTGLLSPEEHREDYSA
jgi:hypothetical protein